MPELPEVESLVRGVRQELLGKRFVDVSFLRPDVREVIPAARLKDILVGETVTEVTRRGKYMLIHTNKGALGVHLGMSGRFVGASKSALLVAHTHARFEVNDGLEYRFIDPRRFGRLFSLEPGEVGSHPFLAKLGVEPLDPGVDLRGVLLEASRNRRQPVKVFLMNSEVVVGVGNIYASEVLWRAKINPHTVVNKIPVRKFIEISRQIIDVLSEAIKAGGTTFRDYRDKDGNPGYFQENLAVYGRQAKPCGRCSSKIVKTTQAARSTYHCPICQK
ncbi:MAG: bifunctional DNA-formamidopyrimidine glycosylase/DNA-(apurinic or apyrimidinic site) lyase [Pseudomonadota bacterium]